jgi:hypothetical protein
MEDLGGSTCVAVVEHVDCKQYASDVARARGVAAMIRTMESHSERDVPRAICCSLRHQKKYMDMHNRRQACVEKSCTGAPACLLAGSQSAARAYQVAKDQVPEREDDNLQECNNVRISASH